MKRSAVLFIILITLSIEAQIKVFEEQTIPGQFSLPTYWWPQLTAGDIDHDGKIDLLFRANYELKLYEQTTTGSCEFILVNDNLISLPISYSTVNLMDLEDDGYYEILTGTANSIDIYTQINQFSYDFTLTFTTELLEPRGWAKPCMAFKDLNNSEPPEMLIGFYNTSPSPPYTYVYGKLTLFDIDNFDFTLLIDEHITSNLITYAAPAFTDYDHDDLIDLIVGGCYVLNYYEQEESNSFEFDYIDNDFDNIDNDLVSFPVFCDINEDGVEDMLIGSLEPAEIRIFIRKLWAEFSYEQITGSTFQFNNESIGDILEFNWDFDNNGTIDSNEENPIWHYDIPGTYQVSLEIVNGIYNDNVINTIEALASSENNVIKAINAQISVNPNPFNPDTKISFSIPKDSKVNLSVYNIKGQLVKTFLNDQLSAGEHSVIWNAKDCSSSVYFYKLNLNGKFEAVKKCLFLK